MNDLIICILRYSAIFACIVYLFSKLLRIKLNRLDLLGVPVFAGMSAALYFATYYIKILIPIGFLIFSIIFLLVRFRRPFTETLIIGTISLGFSIISTVLAIVITSPLSLALINIKSEFWRTFTSQIIIAVIELAAVIGVSNIRRFKNGIYIRKNDATLDLLLAISIICIFAMSIFYTEALRNAITELVFLFIAFCGLLFIVWWRKHITTNYQKMCERRNLDIVDHTAETLKKKNDELVRDNDDMAKIIHRDNKFIPTMVSALKELAEKHADEPEIKQLLDNIENVSNERSEVLLRYMQSQDKLPKTGIALLDGTVQNLDFSAKSRGVDLEVTVSGDTSAWFENDGVARAEFSVILSYICDNAQLAARDNEKARCALFIGSDSFKGPYFRVYDNGLPFDAKVIAEMGRTKITTRKDNGGHGIGLLTVFSTLQKYGASFLLSEVPADEKYTKFIEIKFDGNKQICVLTPREAVAKSCAGRNDIKVKHPQEAAEVAAADEMIQQDK